MKLTIKFELTEDGKLLGNGADLHISALYPEDRRQYQPPGAQRDFIFRRELLHHDLKLTSINLPRGVKLGDSWTQELDLELWRTYIPTREGIPMEEWGDDLSGLSAPYAFIDDEDLMEVPIEIKE